MPRNPLHITNTHVIRRLDDLEGALTAAHRKLYAVSSAGWVFAWNAANGELVWRQPIDPDFADGRSPANNFTFPVPTPKGVLISDKQQPLLLLDYETGKLVHSYRPPETEDWSRFSTFASAFDGQAFLPLRDHLVGFDLHDRKVLWSTPDETKHSSPVLADKDLLLFSVCCSSTRSPILHGNTGRFLILRACRGPVPAPKRLPRAPLPAARREGPTISVVPLTALYDFGSTL